MHEPAPSMCFSACIWGPRWVGAHDWTSRMGDMHPDGIAPGHAAQVNAVAWTTSAGWGRFPPDSGVQGAPCKA